jgi:hypothetical protein
VLSVLHYDTLKQLMVVVDSKKALKCKKNKNSWSINIMSIIYILTKCTNWSWFYSNRMNSLASTALKLLTGMTPRGRNSLEFLLLKSLRQKSMWYALKFQKYPYITKLCCTLTVTYCATNNYLTTVLATSFRAFIMAMYRLTNFQYGNKITVIVSNVEAM